MYILSQLYAALVHILPERTSDNGVVCCTCGVPEYDRAPSSIRRGFRLQFFGLQQQRGDVIVFCGVTFLLCCKQVWFRACLSRLRFLSECYASNLNPDLDPGCLLFDGLQPVRISVTVNGDCEVSVCWFWIFCLFGRNQVELAVAFSVSEYEHEPLISVRPKACCWWFTKAGGDCTQSSKLQVKQCETGVSLSDDRIKVCDGWTYANLLLSIYCGIQLLPFDLHINGWGLLQPLWIVQSRYKLLRIIV